MFCGCIAASSPAPGSFDPLRYNASFAGEFQKVKKYAMPYVKIFKVGVCAKILQASDYSSLQIATSEVCCTNTCAASGKLPKVSVWPRHHTVCAESNGNDGVSLCMQALLAANDYFGISGYGSGYTADPKTLSWRQMEIPLQTLAYEMKFFGIDMKQYMQKEVIYVEQVGRSW